MRKIIPVLLLALAACAGCATRYSLVLTNGDVLTARGKPKYNAQQARYYYIDDNGRTNAVYASKVREVAPSSMVQKEGTQFIK